MPTRSLLIALAFVVPLACAHNPDPRDRPAKVAAVDGYGGWITVRTDSGVSIDGELISVDGDRGTIHILRDRQLLTVPILGITSGELYGYRSAAGTLSTWTLVGTLSTASHGLLLVLSAPAWLLSGSIATYRESNASRVEVSDGWRAIAAWARFPQGLPPGVDARTLVGHRRKNATTGRR